MLSCSGRLGLLSFRRYCTTFKRHGAPSEHSPPVLLRQPTGNTRKSLPSTRTCSVESTATGRTERFTELPLEALHVHSFTRGRRLRYNFAVNHNFAADFIPASRVFACIEEHLAEVSTTGDDDSLHPRKSLAGCTLKDSISIVEFDKVN